MNLLSVLHCKSNSLEFDSLNRFGFGKTLTVKMTIKHKDDVSLGQNAHTVRRNTLLEQRDLLKGNIHSQVDSAVSCV